MTEPPPRALADLGSRHLEMRMTKEKKKKKKKKNKKKKKRPGLTSKPDITLRDPVSGKNISETHLASRENISRTPISETPFTFKGDILTTPPEAHFTSGYSIMRTDMSETDIVFMVTVWRLSQYLDYIEEYVSQDFEQRGIDRLWSYTDTVTQERIFLFRGPPQERLECHKHVIISLRGFLAVQQWKRDAEFSRRVKGELAVRQWKRDAEFSRQVKGEPDQHSVQTFTIDNNQQDNNEHQRNHEMEKNDTSTQLLTPTMQPTGSASKRSSQRQRYKVDKDTPRATRERNAKKRLAIEFHLNLQEDKGENSDKEQGSKEDTSEGQSQTKLVKPTPSKSPATKPYRPEFPNLPSGKEWYAKHPEAKQDFESKIEKAATETAAKDAATEEAQAAEHDAKVEELKKVATTRGKYVRPALHSPKKFNTKPIAPLPNPLAIRKANE